MKMLSGEVTKEESTVKMKDGTELKIKVEVRAVNGIEQASILRQVATIDVIERIKGGSWALKNVVELLVVDDEEFKGDKLKKFAVMFDPTDEATRLVMQNVIAMVANAVTLEEEDAKKS